MFPDYRFDEEEQVFKRRHKMMSGMTADISFEVTCNEYSTYYIWPSLCIYRKRKTAWTIPNEITGKDGLAPLLYAKTEILRFPTYVAHRWNESKRIIVEIGWSDTKRERAYRAYLSRFQYEVNRCSDSKELVLSRHYDANLLRVEYYDNLWKQNDICVSS